MSTSGSVIITDGGDGIYAKVMAQCNGYKAYDLADRLFDLKPTTLQEIADIARQVKFGCPACLVVMTPQMAIHESGDELPSRYWDTFWRPGINPASQLGAEFEHSMAVYIGHAIKEVL